MLNTNYSNSVKKVFVFQNSKNWSLLIKDDITQLKIIFQEKYTTYDYLN